MSKKTKHGYDVKLQRTRTKKVRICLVSANGKLVLHGEALNRTIDALRIAHAIRAALGLPEEVLEMLPSRHAWPRNSGPTKRGAA